VLAWLRKVNDKAAPPVPASQRSARERLLFSSALAVVRVSLLVSPRPAAMLARRVFAGNGKKIAESLEKHAPAGIAAVVDERYGDDPDMLLDVVRPADAAAPLPLFLWVHGGAFIGGSKDELLGYFKVIASHGYVVAAPRYSLAPEHHYPTPPRQLMRALEYLQENADRLGIDPSRIVLGGDSAGAHIAAQLGALATSPQYADAVGVASTVRGDQVRAVVLACGPFDMRLARDGSEIARPLVQLVLWAYSGKRDALRDPFYWTWSVVDNLSPAFPPALVTVGNADPLRAHSVRLVDALDAQGVETETVFFPDSYQPRLNHEYQFDLDSAEGQAFLERLLAFLRRRLA